LAPVFDLNMFYLDPSDALASSFRDADDMLHESQWGTMLWAAKRRMRQVPYFIGANWWKSTMEEDEEDEEGEEGWEPASIG
jgi:hypothetical protein